MPLDRTLGLGGLTFYGLGIILGAGIYSVLGAAAVHAGPSLWMCFAISGLVALPTALAYAELATTYPRAGAEFTYLRRALPRWPGVGLVTGLLVALSGAATCGTVAIAFAGYLQSFVEVPGMMVAWALIAAAAGLNIIGVKESGWVNVAFTLLEAGGLVLFIVVGATTDGFGEAFMTAPSFGVLSGAALVFFSFLGFENIANLAEEAKQPERDLPRAILLSLAIAITLYILVALAAVALMPPEQLADTQAPLADAARQGSSTVAGALGGIALFATANTALVSMLVASRVVFGIAREGGIPKQLSAILPRRETPWLATLVVAAIAAALVPLGNVGVVASLSSFASLLAFAWVNVALIVLRYREPDAKRPFRIPGAIGKFPLLPAFGVAATFGIATQLERTALLGGGVTLVVLGVYAVWWHRRDSRASRHPPASPGLTG
jgi:APA family basic amino acid/polyamine antiporter